MWADCDEQIIEVCPQCKHKTINIKIEVGFTDDGCGHVIWQCLTCGTQWSYITKPTIKEK